MALGHLRSVCMTYAEHARFSLSLAWLFFQGAVCAAVHAVCPFLLASSSTACAAEATRRIAAAGCRSSADASYPPPGDGALHVMADKDD